MTPIDSGRLDFELPAGLLQRALGRGGAPVDLGRAAIELAHVQDALHALAGALKDAMLTEAAAR